MLLDSYVVSMQRTSTQPVVGRPQQSPSIHCTFHSARNKYYVKTGNEMGVAFQVSLTCNFHLHPLYNEALCKQSRAQQAVTCMYVYGHGQEWGGESHMPSLRSLPVLHWAITVNGIQELVNCCDLKLAYPCSVRFPPPKFLCRTFLIWTLTCTLSCTCQSL